MTTWGIKNKLIFLYLGGILDWSEPMRKLKGPDPGAIDTVQIYYSQVGKINDLKNVIL
jgi:hypothetical protein